ncbi:flagellar hook-associated protein FlgK [Chitinilyticum aquatile]|uniref:flagellar hook-associated protein FlgK n=1 Tax=Chitinilyticum aquatile TaxID=362520 RepID=UPI0004105261|nr:flagellar hook-associated protein FlgK [Chitinilyticum aquatile]
MGSSVFGIGVSGLNAANLGLTTTGHNIANVNTPGYSRQRIIQSAPYPQGSGSGFVGMGVKVDTITRIYDQFLTRQVNSTQSQSSYYDALLSHLKEIDNIVADPDAGVSPALQSFFSSVQNVTTNPSNMPSRQQMLASSQTLLNRFQVFEQRLAEQRNSLNGEVTNTVNSINAIAQSIAKVNNQIALTNGAGQPPNDLLDQRDQLVRELNVQVKATTLQNDDGTINVFIGSGQSLVMGGNATTLTTAPSQADPERLAVVYQQGANQVELPDSLLNGGVLGGLLEYRSKSLDLAQNSLNRMALVFAQTFNEQHRAGMDLNGNLGGDYWDFSTVTMASIPPTVPPTTVKPPALGAVRTNQANTGGASLTGYISDVSKLAASDYELVFDAASNKYTLTRLSDGSRSILDPTVAGQDPVAGLNIEGMYLKLSATPAGGDRFTIQPTKGFINGLSVGITDPREIAIAGPVLATPNKTNTGSLKITQPEVAAQTTVTTDAAINPSLRNKVTVTFNAAGTFDVFDNTAGVALATGVAYTPGMTLSYNGWNMKLDGQAAAGDVIVVDKNTATGSADNRNGLALGKLQTTRLMDGGSATYQEGYGRMVAAIGTQTSEAKVLADAQGAMLTQAEQARDSVSGVNLDEEAANLLRYQQAYQAASKLIQIAQQAFQEIINIGR